MRAGLVAASAGLLSACASLGAIEDAPDRQTAAALLVEDFTCQSSDPAKPCDPALQPKEVRLARFDCRSLPLRSGVSEDAHASCAFSGDLIRVNGTVQPIAETMREFSLQNLTPGLRVPERKWRIGRRNGL